MNEQQIEVLKNALKKYGKQHQMMICMEECAELIQAISKKMRYLNSAYRRDALIEEMADVLICMEYLRIVEDINQDEIDLVISNKIKRLNYNISTIDSKMN